ncbi:MAG TPA: hypothetical protein VH186_05505 [Chloroflexia bacterium]|nr:hypothetical protein [Chloroflexia bacterium]
MALSVTGIRAKGLQKEKTGWAIRGWFLGAILIRLLLIPISHHWDIQTWYSMFADFNFGRSPYDTMQTLSFETRLEYGYLYYEYFAYPPGLIYIYWPIAKLYALLDPNLNYSLGAPFSLVAPTTTWYFNYFFKIPVMLADLGIIVLLWKMGGSDIAKRYALNPYILVVMIWMFDPMMVFSLLWTVYSLERKKPYQAALALALGTVIKYVPLFILPAILLYLVRQKFTVFQLLKFCMVFGVVCAGLIIPFAKGTAFTFEFQTARVGGGLTWQHLFIFLNAWFPAVLNDFKATYISATVGAFILPVGMLIVYAYTYRRNLTINSTVLVTVLGYLAFTKIVNEVYASAVIPFILLELQRNPHPVKERYYKVFWSIPLAWIILNVPLFQFFVNPLANMDQLNYLNVRSITLLFDFKFKALVFAVVGTFFTLLCLYAIPRFSVSLNDDKKLAASSESTHANVTQLEEMSSV